MQRSARILAVLLLITTAATVQEFVPNYDKSNVPYYTLPDLLVWKTVWCGRRSGSRKVIQGDELCVLLPPFISSQRTALLLLPASRVATSRARSRSAKVGYVGGAVGISWIECIALDGGSS